ncbi:unnamed protein product, partial [Urochloa humidicola]
SFEYYSSLSPPSGSSLSSRPPAAAWCSTPDLGDVKPSRDGGRRIRAQPVVVVLLPEVGETEAPDPAPGGGGENGACLRIRAARARRTTRPPDPCSAGPAHCMAAGSDGGSGAGASSALHRAGLGFIPSSCGSRSGPPWRGVPARRPCSTGGSLTSGRSQPDERCAAVLVC